MRDSNKWKDKSTIYDGIPQARNTTWKFTLASGLRCGLHKDLGTWPESVWKQILDSHFPCVLVTKIPLPQDILDPLFFPYTLYVHFKYISSLSVLVNVLPIVFYLRTWGCLYKCFFFNMTYFNTFTEKCRKHVNLNFFFFF